MDTDKQIESIQKNCSHKGSWQSAGSLAMSIPGIAGNIKGIVAITSLFCSQCALVTRSTAQIEAGGMK